MVIMDNIQTTKEHSTESSALSTWNHTFLVWSIRTGGSLDESPTTFNGWGLLSIFIGGINYKFAYSLDPRTSNTSGIYLIRVSNRFTRGAEALDEFSNTLCTGYTNDTLLPGSAFLVMVTQGQG